MQAMNITKKKNPKATKKWFTKCQIENLTQNWIKNSKLRNDVRAEEGVVP